MALEDNSYGSGSAVAVRSKRFMAGNATFTSTTTPNLDQIEEFLNQVSGVLNVALSNEGFTIPITQIDARLSCDSWAVKWAAAMVESLFPSTRGFRRERERNPLEGLEQDAVDFASANAVGFANLGIVQSKPDSVAVYFTGEDTGSIRADPLNTALRQPDFTRGQFDA